MKFRRKKIRTTSKIVKKKSYLCSGGPFDGKRIKLSEGEESTIYFKIESYSNKLGRYILQIETLNWEEKC